MPAKSLMRYFGNARIVLSFAILALLVASFAVRAVGYTGPFRQPIMVLPSMPQVSVEPSSSTPPSSPGPVTAAPLPSAIPSGDLQPVRATLRVPSAPVPSKIRQPVAGNDLVATLGIRASWEQGYVAQVRLVNNGGAPIAWRLTVSHSGQENLQLTAVWGAATGEQQGTAFIFQGDALAAGASIVFGYQAAKSGSGNAKPASCAVVGGSCALG